MKAAGTYTGGEMCVMRLGKMIKNLVCCEFENNAEEKLNFDSAFRIHAGPAALSARACRCPGAADPLEAPPAGRPEKVLQEGGASSSPPVTNSTCLGCRQLGRKQGCHFSVSTTQDGSVRISCTCI